MSFFKKILGDNEDLENNLEEEEYEEEENFEPYSKNSSDKDDEKVVYSKKTNPNFILVKPDKREELFTIADNLLRKKCVVLNLELVKSDTRRFVDFLSGVAYALDGQVKKIAINTYLIIPGGLEISGNIFDDIEEY